MGPHPQVPLRFLDEIMDIRLHQGCKDFEFRIYGFRDFSPVVLHPRYVNAPNPSPLQSNTGYALRWGPREAPLGKDTNLYRHTSEVPC